MSSQSPPRATESPQWQNQPQVDTPPGSGQFPQQPGYVAQQPSPPMSPQPVVSTSPYHFCPQCGTRLTPNTTVCSTCGSSVPGPSSPAPMQPTSLPYREFPLTEGSASKAQMAVNVQPANPVKQNYDRRKWIAAWIAMYAIGVLGTVVAFLSFANAESQVAPAITLGESVIFLLLATFVAVRKSQAALITGILIYALDALLALVFGMIGAVLMHLVLLSVMAVGLNATKRLADQSKVVTQPQIQPEFPT